MHRKRHTDPLWFKCRMTAAVLVVCLLAGTGCSLLPAEDEALPPPLIQPTEEELDIVIAAKGSIQSYMKGTAHFVSAATETLAFTHAGGRIKSINVSVGDKVKAGDLLVELETGDLELQLELQKLNVERASLQLKQASTNGGSATDIRLREIDMERELLQLGAMEKRLAGSRLLAPITGIVTFAESLIEGETVQVHQSLITIADPEQMRLTYLAGNAGQLQAVEAGMPAILRYKGKEYAGAVLQTPANAPLTDDETQAQRNAIMLVIGMDNQPEDVQIGHSAELTIELQNMEDVIVLPRAAIRSYMGRNYVQIADGERRKEVDVTVGLTTATEAEISGGIEEGQQVILNN